VFNNNTFVGNHSLTSNGYTTFSVPNELNFNLDFTNPELVTAAKESKKHLFYYRPFAIKLEWNRTLKIEIKTYSLRIGDIIDFFTRKTGLKSLIIKLTNGNCGCEARRQKFNKWFSIPIFKIWFDDHDYEDAVVIRTRFYRKQRIQEQKLEEERLENLYDNVKRNIIEQAHNKEQDELGHSNNNYSQTNQTASPRPASNGCGCGSKMKKTVNYI
jgi:hypothetical protein